MGVHIMPCLSYQSWSAVLHELAAAVYEVPRLQSCGGANTFLFPP